MSMEADRRVIIIGNDLLAVALAAGLARHQIPVHVLVESVTSRARITHVPGLLIPSGPGMTQTQLQRYERWLADLQVDPTAIAFDVLPVAAVHTPQAGTSTFPEIGVVDLTRLRSALRQRLDAMSALIEPARGAQPQWEGQQVVGARQRGGAVVSAREVVLASGLKAGRFWRLPRPAVDLGRQALLRARESGLGTRYMFPFDGSVWVAGDAAPTPAEFPLLAGNGGERAQRLRGIGAEPSLRPYAVQRHALGLLYVWGSGGQGLLALPQMVRGLLSFMDALA
jgi:hypothetical protein